MNKLKAFGLQDGDTRYVLVNGSLSKSQLEKMMAEHLNGFELKKDIDFTNPDFTITEEKMDTLDRVFALLKQKKSKISFQTILVFEKKEISQKQHGSNLFRLVLTHSLECAINPSIQNTVAASLVEAVLSSKTLEEAVAKVTQRKTS